MSLYISKEKTYDGGLTNGFVHQNKYRSPFYEFAKWRQDFCDSPPIRIDDAFV